MEATLHTFYLALRDLDAADRYRLPPPILTDLPPELQHVDTAAFRVVYDDFVTVARGDAARGVAEMDAGLETLGFSDAQLVGLPWFEVGIILSRIPERGQEGIRILWWVRRSQAVRTVEAYLAMAQALEETGGGFPARPGLPRALPSDQDAYPRGPNPPGSRRPPRGVPEPGP